MENNSIDLIYIDDNVDTSLSLFLDYYEEKVNKNREDKEEIFTWSDIHWEPEYTYQDLFRMKTVHEAEIILIDSGLSALSLNGEQIKILFKQFYPFKKVFVLSQQENLITENFVEKYKTNGKTKKDNSIARISWYEERLGKYLDKAISQIRDDREVYKSLKDNSLIDGYQFEKVTDSLKGDSNVELLEKTDIDKLAQIVKELINE